MGNKKLGAKSRVFMKWLNFSLISAKILVRRTSEIFNLRFNKCVEEIVNKFALSLALEEETRCWWADAPRVRFTETGCLQTRPSSLADVSRLHPLPPQNATVQTEYGLLPQTQRRRLAKTAAVMITGTSGRAITQIFNVPQSLWGDAQYFPLCARGKHSWSLRIECILPRR